jgi:hypothetical protein
MIRKAMVFLLVLVLLVSLVMYKNVRIVKAEPSRQRVIFLCEKQEYAYCEELVKFALIKKAMGYEINIQARPDLFVDVKQLRKWLSEQQYFVVYAIGVLDFYKTMAKSDSSYPVKEIKWDAPLWWPQFKFEYVYGSNLPDSFPKILARIPVTSVDELKSWLLTKGVISKDVVGVITTTHIVNTQKSKLFPSFQYDDVNNYEAMKRVNSILKNSEFLVEKRGVNSLSFTASEKQLNFDNFLQAMNRSNVAVLSSSTDPISELYFQKNDGLIAVPADRSNLLTTTYLNNDSKIVEEDYWSSKSEIQGNNRLIILENFYNSYSDLELILKSSRCVVTVSPSWLNFNTASQSRLEKLQLNIVSQFLKGRLLADIITEFVVNQECYNHSMVVWGDPLILKEDLILTKPTEKLDIGFSRSFVFPSNTDERIEFIGLPEEFKFEIKNKEYVFSCSTPVVTFFPGGYALGTMYFLFEFQKNKERGWVFLKLKILNLGGLKNPPFLICI